MMGIYRLIQLFVCAQLVCSINSNVKLKNRWTNITKYWSTSNAVTAIQHMEVLAGQTDIVFAEDHCLRTKAENITGKCDQPGDKMGQDPTYRDIRWFTQLDIRYILILDAGGLRKFDKKDKTTHPIPKTAGLDISSITKIVDTECILFTIKLNSSLMELCSSDLRIVDSSLYPFDNVNTMVYHGNALYVAEDDGIVKVNLMSKLGKTSIKGSDSLALREANFVNKRVSFAIGTKLYLEHSCSLIALNPKKNFIRQIDLNTYTVVSLLNSGESSNKISSLLFVKKTVYIGYSNGTIANGQIQFDGVEKGMINTDTPDETSVRSSPESNNTSQIKDLVTAILVVVSIILVIDTIAICKYTGVIAFIRNRVQKKPAVNNSRNEAGPGSPPTSSLSESMRVSYHKSRDDTAVPSSEGFVRRQFSTQESIPAEGGKSAILQPKNNRQIGYENDEITIEFTAESADTPFNPEYPTAE